jgi:hypothetical protein
VESQEQVKGTLPYGLPQRAFLHSSPIQCLTLHARLYPDSHRNSEFKYLCDAQHCVLHSTIHLQAPLSRVSKPHVCVQIISSKPVPSKPCISNRTINLGPQIPHTLQFQPKRAHVFTPSASQSQTTHLIQMSLIPQKCLKHRVASPSHRPADSNRPAFPHILNPTVTCDTGGRCACGCMHTAPPLLHVCAHARSLAHT